VNSLWCVGSLTLDPTLLIPPFLSEDAPDLTGFLEFGYTDVQAAARALRDGGSSRVEQPNPNVARISGTMGTRARCAFLRADEVRFIPILFFTILTFTISAQRRLDMAPHVHPR
jgi:hypothetical protein